MGNSQLSLEYHDMPERRELYAKYGIAAEAAQLLETDLGTLLLVHRAHEHGWTTTPDAEAARAAFRQMDKSTLGRLVNDLAKLTPIAREVELAFASGLAARNRLFHGFFERHNFKIQTSDGRNEMILELGELNRKVFAAWRVASILVAEATDAVSREVGLKNTTGVQDDAVED